MKAEEFLQNHDRAFSFETIENTHLTDFQGYAWPVTDLMESYAQHVTEEERKINQTLRDQVKSFERIPDPEGKNTRIQKLEARELGFIQSMSEIEKENLGLKMQIKGRDRAEADMEKRITEMKQALDASYSILHGDDHVISKEEVIGMIERALKDHCKNSAKTDLLQESDKPQKTI